MPALEAVIRADTVSPSQQKSSCECLLFSVPGFQGDMSAQRGVDRFSGGSNGPLLSWRWELTLRVPSSSGCLAQLSPICGRDVLLHALPTFSTIRVHIRVVYVFGPRSRWARCRAERGGRGSGREGRQPGQQAQEGSKMGQKGQGSRLGDGSRTERGEHICVHIRAHVTLSWTSSTDGSSEQRAQRCTTVLAPSPQLLTSSRPFPCRSRIVCELGFA